MKFSPPAANRGTALVPGAEFAFTRRDLERIAAIMLQEAGISLSEGKANLVYSRLAKRLRLLGITDFHTYCDLVTQPDGQAERQAMIAALTTNVTRFFREPHHFEHLKTQILPGLVAKAKAGFRVRLWSAACSSGQEPYSIALTLLSLLPDAASYDIKILATDIDPNMLNTGRAGVYEAAQVEAVPAALRKSWFTQAGDGTDLRIADAARALVSFRQPELDRRLADARAIPGDLLPQRGDLFRARHAGKNLVAHRARCSMRRARCISAIRSVSVALRKPPCAAMASPFTATAQAPS